MSDGPKVTLPAFKKDVAPEHSESTRTPCLLSWHATYSVATRFIPPLRDASMQMSEMQYRAVNSVKVKE